MKTLPELTKEDYRKEKIIKQICKECGRGATKIAVTKKHCQDCLKEMNLTFFGG